MASNNPGYTYPRSQQQQQQQQQQHASIQGHNHSLQSYSQQGNYGVSRSGGGDGSGGGVAASGRAEYAAERWPDYGAPQQHHGQYSPGLQHVQGMASLEGAVSRPSSRTADVAPSSITSRTSTASPVVPGRSVAAFNGGGGGGGGGVGVGIGVGGGYDQYTGAHYQAQPSATTATANQESSRTVTAGASFGGYNYGPHYTQSQPPTTIVEMQQQQQQLRTAPQQRVAAQDYIDYTATPSTHTPTSTGSQNYTPLYQTADSIRTQQATSLYTPTPVYQNAAAAATVPSSYEGAYTSVDPQPQRQQHRPRQPQAQPAASTQQPVKQKQQSRSSQFQSVNQQQSRAPQFQPAKPQQYQPAPAAMTQYNNAFGQSQQQQQEQQQPVIQRTPTPSSVAAPYHQPTPMLSPQIQHTHVTPSQLHSPQLQSPQMHSSQIQTQSPQQAQVQPQAQAPQQHYKVPSPPTSETPAKQKAKSKARPKKPQDAGPRIKAWEPSMPTLYKQALQVHQYASSGPPARGLDGGAKPIDAQREQEQRQLIEAQAKRIEADIHADLRERKQTEQRAQYEQQQQVEQRAYQEAQARAQQEAQQRAHQEQQARQKEEGLRGQQEAQRLKAEQEARIQENARLLQELEHTRTLHARQRQLEQQAKQEAHQMQARIEAQRQAELQTHQQTGQYSQVPPQQTNQNYQSQGQPPAPAPVPAPEARPAAPAVNKDLMEAQMKIMVERMRYYQSADPITFQQVWENVRKSGGGGNAGVITNGSGNGGGGAIMARDGSASSSNGEERRQHNVDTFKPQQQPQAAAPNANTNAAGPVPAPPPAPTPVPAAVAPAQPAPAAVVAAPPAPVSVLAPEQRRPKAISFKTAKAISRYLIKNTGHCPPEATIIELLVNVTSFIALCDKLEVMGYKFHRGNFSRYLLAEVDDEEEDAEAASEEIQPAGMDVGESRVLGEVEDDQEQILRELNEARNVSPAAPSPAPAAVAETTTTTATATPERAVSAAAGDNASTLTKRGRGRPRKAANHTQAQAPDSEAPKTPSTEGEAAAVVSSLPTPTSVVAGAYTTSAPPQHHQQPPLSHINTNTPYPSNSSNKDKTLPHSAAQLVPPPAATGNNIQQSSPSPENISPSEYLARQYVPRRPTPQSVKAARATRAEDPATAGTRQFVAPSQIYRPPTPPKMVIDLEQSPQQRPQQLDDDADGPGVTDIEMLDRDAPATERLIVKLKVKSPSSAPAPAPAPALAPVPIPFGATIDLTSTATTPEPHQDNNNNNNNSNNNNNRMPAFSELREQEMEWGQHEKSPDKRPVLIPIPISMPPLPRPIVKPAEDTPLILPLKKEKALVRLEYNPATIARDIMIVTGRCPEIRALNSHLDPLRAIAGSEVDLATIRWDLLDPCPGYAEEIGDMADDEGEGGGLAVATARAPPAAMRTQVKSVQPQVSPVAVGRGKPKKRGSILGASIDSFAGFNGGVTTLSNGDGGAGLPNNTTTAETAETPRTQSSAAHNSNGGPASRTASALRNVMTPDAAAASQPQSQHSFSVVIHSPRAPPSSGNNSRVPKRKSADPDHDQPAAKKPARMRRSKGKGKFDDGPPASGFKVFKCKWEHCPAELHNFETLHRHVIRNHCKLASYGGYPCRWAGCSRPAPTISAAKRGGPSPTSYPMDFNTEEQWVKHMDQTHLDPIRSELGVGPSVGPYDREAVSDVDYLSDSHGRQITPIARPAPEGYVFLPPPQFEANRHLARARRLGAGMEGDETADMRAEDVQHGLRTVLRRVVDVNSASGAERQGQQRQQQQQQQEAAAAEEESEHEGRERRFTVHQ